jgi:hypothetical protein
MEQLLLNQNKVAEDTRLKQKYGDRYAPDIVDTTISNLVTGKVNASREDIWKVINHDENVQKAYLLGKQDASIELKGKRDASSPEGYTTTPSETIAPNKGESDRDFFKRSYLTRLLQNKK